MKDKGGVDMTNFDSHKPETLSNKNDASHLLDITGDIPETIMIEEGQIHQEIVTYEQYEEKTAGFWMRFWAFIIDSLFVTAIIGIVVNPIFYMMDWDLQSFSWYAPISIISAVVYYTYFVVMTHYFRQTVGKMIFGLKVVSMTNTQLNFTTVLFREWIGRIISNAILPLYLLVVVFEKNQALHDYFADTKVVQENVFIKTHIQKAE